jgi:hypothetical protein
MSKARQRERARRRKEARRAIADSGGVKLFHGGRAGMPVGGYILPAANLGLVAREKAVEQMLGDGYDRDIYQPNRVYVSADLNWAICCAARSRFPIAIYEVLPEGELEPDPDCATFLRCYICARARILRKVPVDFRTLQKFKDRWQRRRDLGLPLWDCLEQDYLELAALRSP